MPYQYSQETMDRLLDLGDEVQGRLPRSFIKKYGQPGEPEPAQAAPSQAAPYPAGRPAPLGPQGVLADTAETVRSDFGDAMRPNAPQQNPVRLTSADVAPQSLLSDPYASSKTGDEGEPLQLAFDPRYSYPEYREDFIRKKEPDEPIDLNRNVIEPRIRPGEYFKDNALRNDREWLKNKAPNILRIMDNSKRVSVTPGQTLSQSVYGDLVPHSDDVFGVNLSRREEVARGVAETIENAVERRDWDRQRNEQNFLKKIPSQDIGARTEYRTGVGISAEGVYNTIPTEFQAQGGDREYATTSKDGAGDRFRLFAVVIAVAPDWYRPGQPNLDAYEAHIAKNAHKYAALAQKEGRPVIAVINKTNYRIFNP